MSVELRALRGHCAARGSSARSPGAMQLTRMPRGASSWARALVRPTSAVLDTAYMPSGAPGPNAVMLDTYTIDPPCVLERRT